MESTRLSSTTAQPARLTGLHLLLTYECNYECDHCFVWGGPSQPGTMTVKTIEHILKQAGELGTIEWIYFEGGEPFLYYETLCSGVRLAKQSGFRVGIVSNAYWAESEIVALAWLQPFAGVIDDLSISDDDYHRCEELPRSTHIARQAAEQLGIPVDYIRVTGAQATNAQAVTGKIPAGESTVLYRGRAAEKLAMHAEPQLWAQFNECPYEELRYPERVHVDVYGNMHVCQGISMGNLLEKPLTEVMAGYDPDFHPVIGPLLAGGPAELVERYALPHKHAYADACHLCYESRCKLREKYPGVLTPGQMYGVSQDI